MSDLFPLMPLEKEALEWSLHRAGKKEDLSGFSHRRIDSNGIELVSDDLKRGYSLWTALVNISDTEFNMMHQFVNRYRAIGRKIIQSFHIQESSPICGVYWEVV